MTTFLTANSTLPPYMAFPSFLLDCDFSETTKLLYMVLLNRARLSQKNDGWIDKKGHVFSYFTIEDMAATLRKSQTTIKTSLSALEQVDLICRARQGTGNPNRIYVKVPADFSTQTEEKLSVRQSENRPFDRQNSVRQTVRKLSPNNKEKKNNDSVKRHYECKDRGDGAYLPCKRCSAPASRAGRGCCPAQLFHGQGS